MVQWQTEIWGFRSGLRRWPFTSPTYDSTRLCVKLAVVVSDIMGGCRGCKAGMCAGGQGTFSTQIVVPDVYGVFKFVVDHKAVGYSHIMLEETAPVRPFRHTEFDRFLLAAYPYYASTFSSMLAFFSLGFFFLYHGK